MRDLILSAFVFGSVPFILRKPLVGLLMWVWLGIMNPHRLTWGFAYAMPFAQVIAICTLVSVLFHASKLYRFPLERVTLCMVLFVLWIGVSPFFSFHPEYEFELWLRAIKIQIMVLLAFLVVGEREHLDKLTWVLALSIGFFGIKGGIFTILTAGHHRVWGPEGSFIEDNNALALAVIMGIPLFRYLQIQTRKVWQKRAYGAAIGLSIISAVGSYSRGALLALGAMGGFLLLKSRQKGLLSLLVILAIPLALLLMPDSWTERMGTIKTYDQDASAMGRINAWWVAWNLAVDRIPIGGGFAMYEPDVFARYAPNPEDLHAAHSIYFQILGEHGFVGLAFFLGIFWFSWRNGSRVIRAVADRPGWEWARDLAAMCQVSLIGYGVGGAFLSLTYFDLPYYVAVILAILRAVVDRDLPAEPNRPPTPYAAAQASPRTAAPAAIGKPGAPRP